MISDWQSLHIFHLTVQEEKNRKKIFFSPLIGFVCSYLNSKPTMETFFLESMLCISIQDSSTRTNQFFILIAVFVFSLKTWKSVNSILDTAFSLLQIKIYFCFSSSFFTLPSPLILRYKFGQKILIYVPEILLGLQTLICRISDAAVVWNFQRVTTTLFGLQPFL